MKRVVLMAPRLELRGSTVYTLTLARELKLRGYNVAVVAAEGPFVETLLEEKIPYALVNITGNLFQDVLFLNRAASSVKSFNPELIHVTHHDLAGVGGFVAGRLSCPYILTIQSPVRNVLRHQRKQLRVAIAISQPSRQSAVNKGRLPRELVRIVENGVSSELKPPEKNGAGLVPVVGTASRLVKDLGIKYFIHAARELISRNVRAHFLILGTGPEEARLRKLIRGLEICSHVTINSACPDLNTLIRPIDIFVSPALSEGFSIFVLKAMASAVPVVASAAGGVFSLINDKETGLIVPKKDVSLFADKIQAFLDDREYAKTIGLNGFNYVQENFPIKKTMEKTLSLYQEAETSVNV